MTTLITGADKGLGGQCRALGPMHELVPAQIWLVHPKLSQVIFTLDASERRRDDDRADGSEPARPAPAGGENDDSY